MAVATNSTKFYSGFDPRSIPGCVTWLDAADDRTFTFGTGSNVAAWADKSTLNYNVSQATAGNQPVRVLSAANGFPVVRFTQASLMVLSNTSMPASLGAGPASFFLVEQNMTAPSGNPGPFGFAAGPNGGVVIQYNPGFTGALQPFSTIVTNYTFASPRLDYFNRTNTGTGGVGTINGNIATVGDTTTGTYSGALWVGRAPNGYHSGDTCELIIYSSNLTAAERQQVEGYLIWKWRINVASTFSPTSIPNCSVWLDAADSTTITQSASVVSEWRDKSQSALVFTQPTVGARPTVSTASPLGTTVFFTTAQTISSSNTLTLSPIQSWFVVFRATGSANYFFIEHSANTNANPGSFLYGGNANLHQARRAAGANLVNDSIGGGISPFSLNVSYAASFVADNTNNSYRWKINGTTRATTLASTFISLTGDAITNLFINTRVPSQVHMAEILIYNRALSVDEVNNVESYLMLKWGVAANIPTSHPYKNNPINTRGFQPSDIASCVLWMDAADGSTMTMSGSSVLTWKDKSTNGYTATQLGTITLGTQNKLSTIVLNGVRMSIPNFVWKSTFTLVFVANSASANFIYSQFGTAYLNYVYVGNNNLMFVSPSFNVQDTVPGAVVPANTYYIFTISYNNGTTAPIYRVSGTTRTTQTGTASSGTQTNTLYINGNGNFAFENVSVAEILHYDTLLSLSEVIEIEGYLANKWGIQTVLPSAHDFKLFPPSSPLFVPSSLTGLQLWLDPADSSTITLSGANVTQWRDKSGNSTTMAVSAGTPTLSQFNGLPSVYFNGAARMASSNYTGLQGVRHINWFAVANPTSINLNYGLLIGTNYNTNANSQNDLYILSNNVQVFYRIIAGGASKSVSKSITGGNAMIASSFANLVDGTCGAYYNGVGATSTGGPIGTQDSTASSLYVGQDNFPGEAFITGTISECLLYTRALTTFERQTIEGYLAWKWGLRANLPTTHPYYKFRP